MFDNQNEELHRLKCNENKNVSLTAMVDGGEW